MRTVFMLLALAALIGLWTDGSAGGVLLAAPVLVVGAAATLRQLRQQADALEGKIAAAQLSAQEIGTEIGQLRDAVQAREPDKRVMTDEERARLTTLTARQKTQREILTSLLEEKHALTEDLAAAEAANEAARTAPDPDDADPDAAASARAAAAAGLQPHRPRIEVVDPTTRPGYFGLELLAVRSATIAMQEGRPIPRSDQEILNRMQAAATGLNTDIPSEGGYLVAPQRSGTILQRSYETGSVLSRVFRQPIGPGSNGMQLPAIDETSRADSSRYGGIVSTWVGQGTSVTSGKPKFRIMDMKLRKCMATVYATDEQLVDAIALEGWVNRFLPLELAFRVEDAIINGLGSNQPLGVLNSGAVISITRNTASKIIYDDVKGMWLRLWAGSRGIAGDLSTTVWLVEQSAEGELENLQIPIGTAGVLAPIYKPAGTLPGQRYAHLYGRPVIPVEYCAALGTAGDLILVDLSQYVVIDKGAVEQAVSMHVAFLTDEQVFRFIYRVDGQLQWNAALTPKSAGNTLSCALNLSTV